MEPTCEIKGEELLFVGVLNDEAIGVINAENKGIEGLGINASDKAHSAVVTELGQVEIKLRVIRGREGTKEVPQRGLRGQKWYQADPQCYCQYTRLQATT